MKKHSKKVKIPLKFGSIKGLCWGAGNAKKILALHGWLDNAASFTQLAPLIAECGYEIIAIDFSGHGKSQHRAKGHFVHFIDYVLEIAEVLQVLQWHKPILLGHSMGAAMAIMYSAANPDKIDKQILIENLGPVPPYVANTAASNLQKAINQWQNHRLKHRHYYKSVAQAIAARTKVTPMDKDIIKPMVKRGLKKTKKGYQFSTDKRLVINSLFRLSEEIIQDLLQAKKPKTQVIIAEPLSYALDYPMYAQRLEKLNPDEVIKIKGHHHLHMDNAEAVFQAIKGFL